MQTKNFLSIILIITGLLFITSCKNKSSSETKRPEAPSLSEIKSSEQKVSPSPKTAGTTPKHIRPLMEAEEIDCNGACRQLSYCNEKMLHKTNSLKELQMCAKTCVSDTTPTGKAKWDAVFKCLKTHRGEDCKGLRKCMEDEMIKIRKQLHK